MTKTKKKYRHNIFYLHKNSEEDDHNGCCDEESFFGEVIDQEDQREADRPSQAAVGNNELIAKGHHIPTHLVHHSCK